jgi:hypothetical protein
MLRNVLLGRHVQVPRRPSELTRPKVTRTSLQLAGLLGLRRDGHGRTSAAAGHCRTSQARGHDGHPDITAVRRAPRSSAGRTRADIGRSRPLPDFASPRSRRTPGHHRQLAGRLGLRRGGHGRTSAGHRTNSRPLPDFASKEAGHRGRGQHQDTRTSVNSSLGNTQD